MLDNLPLPLNTPPPQNAAQEEATQHEQDRSILRRMDSEDYATRKEAMQECRRLPPRRIIRLMYALEVKTERKPILWQHNVVLGVFSGICILVVCAIATGASVFIFLAALLFVLFFACGSVESTPVKFYTFRAADSLASVIEDIRDPDFLPIALRILNTRYSSTPYNALDRVPKALECAAVHLLTTLDIQKIQALVQQETLHWFLKPSCWTRNPIISVRVLNILEVIGTPTDIPDVKCLAHQLMPPLELLPVRKAAQACLLALSAREKESKLPDTLLRAAAAPAPAADTLLRPVVGSAENAPAQLLRAAASTADE